MPFTAGHSGNPGGRPKTEPAVRSLARQHTEAAIKGLAAIIEDSESDLAKVAAANALLDRGWGKPTVHIEGDLGISVGIDTSIAEDIARIFGVAPAARPAADAEGKQRMVSGKADRGRAARPRKA